MLRDSKAIDRAIDYFIDTLVTLLWFKSSAHLAALKYITRKGQFLIDYKIMGIHRGEFEISYEPPRVFSAEETSINY